MECPQWRSSAGLLTGNNGAQRSSLQGGCRSYEPPNLAPEATVNDGWNWI